MTTSSRPADPDRDLVRAIRIALAAAADPHRAPPMQAYMKSAMPYRGVPVPAVRRIVSTATKAHPVGDLETGAATALTLWREAEFREDRYAATALIGQPSARGRLELLPVLEEMIVTGAWWDHVDEVSHRIGELLAGHPAEMTPRLRRWSVDENLWRRRSSIIAQLDRKQATDVELLTDVIVANLDDREFFIRKAIGWALRQYARTDADWVSHFVERHRAELSPLSRREALKHIG